MKTVRNRTWILAAPLALALVSCGDDAVMNETPSDQGSYYPLPLVSDGDTGRDQAIANLENAFTDLDFEEYARLIHGDYVFVVDPIESDLIGATELSAAEDLQSTQHMFAGETGIEKVVDDNGKPTGDLRIVPPVDTIDIMLEPEPSSQWQEESAGRFQGAFERIYRLEMLVEHQGGEEIDHVVGAQHLYLEKATQTRRIDGAEVEVQVWQIVGWQDMGIGTGRRFLEDSSLGMLKHTF
jgi:hypothetical protein